MLCEGRLLSMTYFDMVEEHDPPALQTSLKCAHGPPEPTPVPAPIRLPPPTVQSSLVQAGAADSTASLELYISPLQSLDLQGILIARQISPKIEIPAQACSGGEAPFLVPSSCQSICKNYSDLHIGGDQVLPLSANQSELRVCPEAQAVRPFLQSCDVPPDEEDSLLGQALQAGQLHPLRKGSNRWRQGSGRDWSVLFQGHEGPFSNSLLNHYLEQKILDLYQQYIMENVERQGTLASEAGNIFPLLGSELVLTSLDQITLQLSREGNLEAGLAKDMVLSCLLRVAGDMQSSEISTPFLQFSNEASAEQLAEKKEE